MIAFNIWPIWPLNNQFIISIWHQASIFFKILSIWIHRKIVQLTIKKIFSSSISIFFLSLRRTFPLNSTNFSRVKIKYARIKLMPSMSLFILTVSALKWRKNFGACSIPPSQPKESERKKKQGYGIHKLWWWWSNKIRRFKSRLAMELSSHD